MHNAIIQQAHRIVAKRLFGDPDHGDWIYERIRGPRAILATAANLLYYTLRRPYICNMTTIQMEPAFACNLHCKYCPGSVAFPGRIRPALMSHQVFRRTIDLLPPTVDAVQFALLGEPLLHPELGDMIDYIHRRRRSVVLFTNGTLLQGDRLEMMVRSRVDVVNVSVEVDHEASQSVRGVDLDVLRRNVMAFAERKSADTAIKVFLVVHKHNLDRLPRLYEYWGDLIEHFKIVPEWSLGPTHPPPVCMDFWRGNFNVWTDGNVSPCCFDINEKMVIGNVLTSSFAQMIRGTRMTRLLQDMLDGKVPERCHHCYRFEGYVKGINIPWAKRDA